MVFKSKAKLDPILGKKGINILRWKLSISAHKTHKGYCLQYTQSHTHTKHPGTYCYLWKLASEHS